MVEGLVNGSLLPLSHNQGGQTAGPFVLVFFTLLTVYLLAAW